MASRCLRCDRLIWRGSTCANCTAKKDAQKNANRHVNDSQRQRILDRDGYRCQWTADSTSHDGPLVIDHIVPVSMGGSSDDSNLRALCRRHNARARRNQGIKCPGIELSDSISRRGYTADMFAREIDVPHVVVLAWIANRRPVPLYVQRMIRVL